MLLGLLKEHNVGKIVHAGGISGPMLSKDNPHHINHVNLLSTIDLAEAARQQGVERFVYCSSGSAYGVTPESPVTEDTPFRPTSVYGATKAASDLVLMAFRDEYDLDVIGLRYSSVYGPRRATDCAIRTMIEDAMAKRPTKLYWGAGEFWPFVYVTDIVTATAAALDAPKTPQYAYNVAGPDMPAVQRIAELVYEFSPTRYRARVQPAPRQARPLRPLRRRPDLTGSRNGISNVASAYIDWFLKQGRA